MIRVHFAAALAAALVAAPLAGLAQTKPPASAAKPAEDAVVAKIDGQIIKRSDVETAMLALPAELRSTPLQMIYPQLLEKLIERKLAAAAGRKAKLDNTDDFKRQMAFMTEGALEQAYFGREIEAALSPDRLRERFAKLMAGFKGEEEVSARHILVETEADAKRIAVQLEQGADFGKLAAEKSTDPSAKSNGGDLGYFTKAQMVPEFAEAAFALKVGQVSRPVKSSFGWHIIVVDGRRESPPPSYEEAVEQLRSEVARDVVGEATRKLVSAAKVERFTLDGKPMPAPAAAPR